MLTRLLLVLVAVFFLVFVALNAWEGRFGVAAIVAIPALIVFLGLYLDSRRARSAPPSRPVLKPASLVTPVVIVFVVLSMDAVLGAALLSGVAAFFSGTAGLLWALSAFRDRRVMLTRLRAVAIVLVPAAAAVAYGTLDDRLARERVAATAATLKAYKAKHGSYPGRLDALVPEYLSELPRARSFGPGRRLDYLPGKDGSAKLTYVSIPPFGRSVLEVESGKWEFYD